MLVLGELEIFGRGKPTYAMNEAASQRPWSYAEHTHAGFCELLYVLVGEIEHRVAGRPRALRAGQLTLIRERDRHALSGARAFRFCNVNIPDATWRALGEFLGPHATRALDRAAEPPVATVPERERPLIEGRLDELFAAQGSPGGDALLRRFLVESVVTLVAGAPSPRGPEMPPWLRELIDGVDDRRLATLDAAALARLAGKSHEHVARTFRARLGTTPTRWLHRQRLQRAALRLSHSNQPIASIALGLGFAHLGYFYRLFRAEFGAPPNAYRRRHAPAALRASVGDARTLAGTAR